MLFVCSKSFHKKKINRLEIVLIAILLSWRSHPETPESDFEQVKNSFQRNSVTYRMPCHATGHFVFGHCECYGFERVFFTLHSFLLVLRPPQASSSTSKLAELHADLRNIALAKLIVWISTIHKRGIVVGSIYSLQLAGFV